VKGLIRVGPNEDGGYVLPLPLLKSTDMLLGFGLSTDWRFEEEFRGRSGCKVECYDHTINPAFWRRKVVTDSAGFLAGPQRFTWSKFRYMLKYREYRRFFSRPEVIHHQLKVGYDGDGSVSLKTILARITTESVFLKIDIEGWEYRIMEDLVNTPDNVLGFVMELHDIDLHRDRICAFIEKLGSFSVVHLHANNGAAPIPVVIPSSWRSRSPDRLLLKCFPNRIETIRSLAWTTQTPHRCPISPSGSGDLC